jgi:hypothetical protein
MEIENEEETDRRFGHSSYFIYHYRSIQRADEYIFRAHDRKEHGADAGG